MYLGIFSSKVLCASRTYKFNFVVFVKEFKTKSENYSDQILLSESINKSVVRFYITVRNFRLTVNIKS